LGQQPYPFLQSVHSTTLHLQMHHMTLGLTAAKSNM